jgi:hypothetical protein
MAKGTSLILIPQPDCPAALASATHVVSDFLHSAILRNVSEKPLIGFRLGWVLCFPSRKTKFRLGARVRLPQAVEPFNVSVVPAQGVRPENVREAAKLMAFFVAEVFLVGEKPWKADLAEIQDDVRRGCY